MDKQIPINHKTYVVASEQHDGPWSLAYVSQVYGTIFGIYTNMETEQKKDRFICRRIHLKLGNFKGLVMLGISNVVVTPQPDPITGEPMLLLDVEVKGLETQREYSVDLSDQLIEVQEGTKIVIQRHLKPMHASTPEYDGLFDTEFYYRDAPDANVVDFAQHAEAFFAYKNGQPSEIRENILSEFTPGCIMATRYIKIE